MYKNVKKHGVTVLKLIMFNKRRTAMKKICILLLTTTHLASLSCMMEAQYQELFYSSHNDSNATPLQIITPQQQPQYICTANQPGWEQLENIINLTPIYRQKKKQPQYYASTQKSIKKQEEKLLLRTITPVQPSSDLIEQLYNNAFTVIAYHRANNLEKKSKLAHKRDINRLINNMKKAQNNGINEDMMGAFTHNKWSPLAPSYLQYIVICFNCLKHYRLTVSETQEPLPLFNHTKKTTDSIVDNPLAYTIGIADTKPKKNIESFFVEHFEHPVKEQIDFPAYCLLVHYLNTLCYQHVTAVETLSYCLYSDTIILWQDCERGSYADFNNDFYDKADSLLQCRSYDINTNTLYSLLKMIDIALLSDDITHETDLAYNFLSWKPAGFFNYFRPQENIISMNNRVSMLCTLIKKYNQARGDKVTPTDKQYICYKIKKELDFALPDSFNQSQLFNEKFYAFAEFEKLINDIELLINTNNQKVQQCVDQLYPQRKLL